eukprot:1160189-Pelagomonas_calceolata.AAC.5
MCAKALGMSMEAGLVCQTAAAPQACQTCVTSCCSRRVENQCLVWAWELAFWSSSCFTETNLKGLLYIEDQILLVSSRCVLGVVL